MRVLALLMELGGFLAVVGFAFLVWPPAALLVAGVGLLVAAQAVER